MPHSLIVEGMAQTAGILVGEASNFSEKVILAKIGRRHVPPLVRPGETIVYSARIDQFSEQAPRSAEPCRSGWPRMPRWWRKSSSCSPHR